MIEAKETLATVDPEKVANFEECIRAEIAKQRQRMPQLPPSEGSEPPAEEPSEGGETSEDSEASE